MTFNKIDILTIIVVILVIKLSLYYYPTLEPYLAGNVYNAIASDNFEIKTVAELKNENNVNEDIQAYYIGRASCIDCRVAIGNTLKLSDVFSKKYKKNMSYVQLKNNINDNERAYLDSIGIDNIPVIIISYNGVDYQFEYDDIISQNSENNFVKFMDNIVTKGD